MRIGLVSALVLVAGTANAATIVVDVPKDGSDAAPAINMALTKAKSGDIVQIPAGTFNVAASIALVPGVTLEGSGTTLNATGSIDAMVTVDGANGATLRKLTLDGGGTKAKHGIVGAGVKNLLVDAMEVRNLQTKSIFGPFGVYFSNDVTDSKVTNSNFHDIGTNTDWGVAIRIESGARDLVEGNTSLHTGRGAFHIKKTVDTIIRKNKGHDFAPLSDALGIEAFEACDRAVIEDNEIDSWLSLDSSPLVAVRRNTIQGMMTTRNGQLGLEIVASPDVLMTDNKVIGPLAAGTGISIDSTNRLYLGRNVIDGVRGTLLEAQFNSAYPMRPSTGSIYSYANHYLNAPMRAIHPHGPRTAGIVFDHDELKTWGSDGFFVQAPQVLLDAVTMQNTKSGSGFFTDATEVYVRDCMGANCPSSAPSVPSPSPLPKASFVETESGLDVDVDASESADPSGGALHFLWDFGEGPVVTGAKAKHSFATRGTKSIALVVWNDAGWGARAEQTFDLDAPIADAGADAVIEDAAATDSANASDSAPSIDPASPSTSTDEGSCGCTTPGARPGSWLALTLVALLARRQRSAGY